MVVKNKNGNIINKINVLCDKLLVTRLHALHKIGLHGYLLQGIAAIFQSS